MRLKSVYMRVLGVFYGIKWAELARRPYPVVLAAAPQKLVPLLLLLPDGLVLAFTFFPDLLGISSSAPLHESTIKTSKEAAQHTSESTFREDDCRIKGRACKEVDTHTNLTRCRRQLLRHGLGGSKTTAHRLAPAISLCFVRECHYLQSKQHEDGATQKHIKPLRALHGQQERRGIAKARKRGARRPVRARRISPAVEELQPAEGSRETRLVSTDDVQATGSRMGANFAREDMGCCSLETRSHLLGHKTMPFFLF